MEARPLSELYKEFSGLDVAYILGAAPCLNNELPLKRPKGSFVFVLNSAFMKYQDYDIHLIANREFIGLYQKDFTKRGIAIRANSFPATGYEREYYYYPSHSVMDGEEPLSKCGNSLMAGHSVLVPALNFVLRCRPKSVVLYGIDMNSHQHWDDGKHKNASANYKKFPGIGRISRQIKLLRRLYPNIDVSCVNKHSVLVKRGIVRSAATCR